MALLRYQIFLSYAVAFLSVWYFACQQIPSQGSDHLTTISSINYVIRMLILYAPLWLVVGVGSYALTLLILGVVTFRDRPDAAAELDRDVAEARKELAKRGIDCK
jgi:hypothetical protein